MNTDVLSKMVVTKICSVSTMYSESGRKIKKVNRPNWAIVIKYEGETVYTSDGKRYVSNANNMVILPKGICYEAQFVKSGYFSIIEFESESEHGSILHFPLKNSDKILELFKKMEYKKTLNEPTYEIDCMQYTYAIIGKLIKASLHKYTPDSKRDKLSPALEYIAKNYTKKITNGDLASLTGFSVDHFRKLFLQAYGISAIEYVNELRIKKAKEMLKSDYISISDIAFSLGYSSVYDFSRAFKRTTGISPSKYCNSP